METLTKQRKKFKELRHEFELQESEPLKRLVGVDYITGTDFIQATQSTYAQSLDAPDGPIPDKPLPESTLEELDESPALQGAEVIKKYRSFMTIIIFLWLVR